MPVSIDQGFLYNTGEGSISLTSDELASLVNGTTTSGIDISTGSSISFEVKLQNRFVLEEIRYWGSNFESASILTSQDGAVWDSPAADSFAEYLSISGSLSSFDNWPKYVRVFHSAATSDISAHELQIHGYSDSTFFEDSPGRGVSVDSSAESEPSEIYITNEAPSSKDIHCFVDVGGGSDTVMTMSLGTTYSGTYNLPHSLGYRVPRDYSWSAGQHSGTTVSGSYVILLSASGTGTYTTPVFDLGQNSPTRLYWEFYDETGTSISSDESMSPETAEVRFSNTAPTYGWTTGAYPSPSDTVWSDTGTLQFSKIANEDFMEASIGQYRYVQARLTFNGSPGTSSRLSAVGFEYPTTLSGVAPHQQRVLYAKSENSSYSVGNVDSVITLSFE